MKKLLLIGALCIPLMGCNTLTALTTGTGSVASTQPSVSIATEKSLTIAHLAYNGLSQVILAATKTGAIKGATATTVKLYYDKAGDALLVADKADAALNDTGVISAINDATDAINSAQLLVNGGK